MILSADMTSRQHYLDSVNVSMEDLEAREFSPTLPDMPSCHSGFRSPHASEYSEAEHSEASRSYSPPAWRKGHPSGWFNQALSPHRGGYSSKDVSPQYASCDETDEIVSAYRTARRIPLPASPIKGRSPSNSPAPATTGGAADEDHVGGGTSTVREMSEQTEQAPESPTVQTPTQNNCKWRMFICRRARSNMIERHPLFDLT